MEIAPICGDLVQRGLPAAGRWFRSAPEREKEGEAVEQPVCPRHGGLDGSHRHRPLALPEEADALGL